MRSQHSEPRLLPGLASTLGLLFIGIGIFSGAAHSAVGGEPESEPTLSYGAPGLEATDHGLVFVKRPPSCEKDRLVLFWDAGRPTQEFEKVWARVQFDLGDLHYTFEAMALPVPSDPEAENEAEQILVFTTPEIDPDFFRYAQEREVVRVKIIGPEPLLDSIASIQQSFDISGLNAQRNQTHAQCEAQTPATPTELPLAENSLMS